jgi:hypothetical protein
MRLECIVVVQAMFASNGAQRCERSAMSWGTQQRQIGPITCHVMMIHWLQHVVGKCQ